MPVRSTRPEPRFDATSSRPRLVSATFTGEPRCTMLLIVKAAIWVKDCRSMILNSPVRSAAAIRPWGFSGRGRSKQTVCKIPEKSTRFDGPAAGFSGRSNKEDPVDKTAKESFVSGTRTGHGRSRECSNSFGKSKVWSRVLDCCEV